MVTSLIKSNYDNDNTISKPLLMHDIYRLLLNTDRTYAAFERERIEPLLKRLGNRKEILDPMSGYGSLMTYCAQSEYDLTAFDIECNAPSYFWQVLRHPKNFNTFLSYMEILKPKIDSLPEASCLASIADTWFTEESVNLLFNLWDLCLNSYETLKKPSEKQEIISLAFILPFIGRLASFVQGNVVTHVKPGGICVYKDWKKDLTSYIDVLASHIMQLKAKTKRTNHKLILGDCRNIKIPKHKFSAMITSPPYPNSRDYSTMFAPENAFIDLITKRGLLSLDIQSKRLIGSPKVSEKDGYRKRTISDIQSASARNFISNFQSVKCNKQAKYDNEIYYIPYYCNYFYDIEMAYKNISDSFSNDFEGYVVVVNNTARKKVIPVAEAIIDTWHRLGFNAEVDPEFTRELSHVGGLNPDVKGLSARHTEYTIKVWRR